MKAADKERIIHGLKTKLTDLKRSTDTLEQSAALNSIYRSVFNLIESRDLNLELLDLCTSEINPRSIIISVNSMELHCKSYEEDSQESELVIVYASRKDLDQNRILQFKQLISSSKAFILYTDSNERKKIISDEVFVNKRNVVSVESKTNSTLEKMLKEIDKVHGLKYFSSVQNVGGVNGLLEALEMHLKIVNKKIRARTILNSGDMVLMKLNDVQKYNDYSTELKRMINTELNAAANDVKVSCENYSNKFHSTENEVNLFIKKYKGFRELVMSKAHSISITDGFIETVVDKTESSVSEKIEKDSEYVNSIVARVQDKVNHKLSEIEIEPISTNDEIELSEPQTIVESVYQSGISLERTITAKGIMTLLMDLRTPIYMMMPLLMIGGIFAMLLKSDDVGRIDEQVRNKSGYEAIIITEFPPSWGLNFENNFALLEEKINDGLNNGVFAYENTDRLVHDREEGNRGKVTKVASLEKDSRNETATILVSSDRNEVIETLFNPSNNILMSKTRSGGMMFGYSAIGRGLSKVPHKRVIFFVLIGLLAYYIRNKSKSFDIEKDNTIQKEKRALKEKLKGEITSYSDSLINRWKAESVNFIKLSQLSLVSNMESQINAKSIEQKTILTKTKDRVDLRAKAYKDEERKIKDILKNLTSIKTELNRFKIQMHL